MTQSAKARRQGLILAELRINRSIRVADLAEKFGTSTETIRRDLDEMKAAELLDRTHGGAKSIPLGREPSLAEREQLFLAERRRIAAKAVASLRPNDVVMMDTGTTTLEVAKAVSIRPLPLTVLTNSYPAATILGATPQVRVIMPPGEFTAAESMVNGSETNEFIRRFNANVCITGASGITRGGPADTNLDATRLKRTMIGRADRVFLLADHSKFDKYALETVCPWSQISALITDRAPGEAFRELLALQGVELVVAGDGAAQ